jgi:hypothetical protein
MDPLELWIDTSPPAEPAPLESAMEPPVEVTESPARSSTSLPEEALLPARTAIVPDEAVTLSPVPITTSPEAKPAEALPVLTIVSLLAAPLAEEIATVDPPVSDRAAASELTTLTDPPTLPFPPSIVTAPARLASLLPAMKFTTPASLVAESPVVKEMEPADVLNTAEPPAAGATMMSPPTSPAPLFNIRSPPRPVGIVVDPDCTVNVDPAPE